MLGPISGKTRPRGGRQGRGLSAVELITIVFVMVILAAFAIPSMSPVVLRYRLRGAAWQVAGDLRLARQQAVTVRKRFRVCVTNCAIGVPAGGYSMERDDGTAGSAQWVSPTGAATRLPADVAVSANATPIFWADGRANPMGTFTVTNPLGKYQVAIASTGRVRVCQGTCSP